MVGVGVQGLLADRYQLQELLGRGTAGEVWRASDEALGRPVAVKLLHAEGAADTGRFRLEAQISARLNHPNVVGMYDFGSHQDQLYLAMELVEGWSLAQERSARGVLDPPEAAAIAAQAAAGLAAAHRQGVVHRDVKPANLMLSPDRTVKIADFGIARFTEDVSGGWTATGKIVGTACYLAPERALGRPAQPASDVYSLGCVLYELLTGQPPFIGATALAVVRQHVDATPPPPESLRPGIPKSLSDYVLRLLAKDPARRPTADQAADWLTARHGTPIPAEPYATTLMPAPAIPSPPAPPTAEFRTGAHARPRSRGKPSSRALLCSIGLALFAGTAGLGASLNTGGDAPTPPTTSLPTTPAPPDGTPNPTPPSAHPSIAAPPAHEHGDNKDDKRSDDAGDGDGKAHGRHSRD
ncbi:serine/threonine-protein kinase [Streptomyces sp. NPDC059010]|uniref:serine/threonine-protein kinase n=1 Tax=Streptomyces sp. NPDC059010 TaxID=3346695 RepID=UPI0036B9E33A